MTTLLTVMRSGGRYDAGWVERLHRAAREHLSGIERHACLSDSALDVPGVRTVRLRHDWPGWWAKMETFRPDVATGRTVLLDLDTLLLDDASALLAGAGVLAMHDFFHTDRLSTAIMAFDAGLLSHVYHRFAADPDRWMVEGSCGPVPNAVHGDQVVVDRFLRDAGTPVRFVQREHPDLIEFHRPDRPLRGPIHVFIGDAKPDTAPPHVRAAWRGERLAEAA